MAKHKSRLNIMTNAIAAFLWCFNKPAVLVFDFGKLYEPSFKL